MPSIIKKTTGQDYNLLGTFTSDDGSGNEYTYSVPASSVKMWLDFAETPVDRSNYSAGISAISYVKTGGSLNNPTQGTDNVGGLKEYSTIRTRLNTPNAGHVRVDFTSTTNDLTFGDGSSDSAFSVSFWYNRESAYSENSEEHLIQKGDGSSKEIDIRWHPNPDGSTNGAFNIRLFDGSNEIFCQVFPYDEDFFEDTWSHLAITYDGSSSHTGISFYINGALQSFSHAVTSGYTAMSGVSNKLYIGATSNAISTDGTFSELAFFSEELSQNTVRAIYYATKDGATIEENNYYSGTVSNPAKDIIKTLDSRIKNIHDCGVKKSTQKRNFDDTNTIDFVERELIGSIGVEESKTSTPYIALNAYSDYGIKVTGKFDSSRTTSQVRNTFEGDVEPFKESEKIFLGKDFSNDRKISFDILDQAGLARDVNQKDIIEIDLKPNSSTTFGIENGVGSYTKNDVMAYWNNSTKTWDKFGGIIFKPSSIQSELEDAKIGFAPTSGFIIPDDKNNFNAAFKNYGMHIDNFGFPKHPKYQAKDNQYIEVSDYVCEPFVVEKMAYEFDAVMHVDKQVSSGYVESKTTTNFSQIGHLYAAYTFFILNERPDVQYKNSAKSTITDGDNISIEFSEIGDDVVNNRTTRDLVGYMQAAVFSDADDSNDQAYGKFQEKTDTSKLGTHNGFLKEGLSRELNISGSNFINSGSPIVDADFAFSGSAVMSGSVFDAGSHESFGMTFNVGGSRKSISDLGAYRSDLLKEKIYPRGFGNGLKINEKNENISVNHSLFLGASLSYDESTTIKKTYYSNLRRPNPYIIKPGDRLVFGWQTPVPVNCFDLNDSNGSSKMTINTSTGRLKLYGTFLRNEKVRKSSEVFYENNYITKPIGCCVTDQYQIEKREELEKAYFSYEFEGALPEREGKNKKESSQKIKSSIHFTHHKDESESIYDSYLPSMTSYLERRGVTSLNGSQITALSDLNIFKNHRNYTSVYIQNQKRQSSSKVFIDGKDSSQTREIIFTKGFDVEGDSDGFSGAKSILYGMYNYNVSRNSAQFNTRHFGHFSDIIEQRRSYAHEFKGKIIYPLEVGFFKEGKKINPKESTSQNIYPHAESYFPFYDGEELTFRFDDTTKIDDITIESDMLDETIKAKQEEEAKAIEFNFATAQNQG
jgi:hypothetical protein